MDDTRKYVVQEMQYDGTNMAMLPPVLKDTRNEADSAFYSILSFAAVSDVKRHTVIMYTDQGFLIMAKSYDHGLEPISEPEPADPTPAPEPEE